jgi:hypothetical protein
VAERAIAAIVEQTQRVAGALARHNKPVELTAAPSERTDCYALDFGDKEDKKITVYAQVPSGGSGKGSIIWPLIDGEEATEISKEPVTNPSDPSGENWYMATYKFKPPASGEAAKLELAWEPLDVLTLQTGSSACWRTRNSDLSGGLQLATNPAFVYKTAEVAYDNPVVPSIVAANVHPDSEGTLAQTLERALAPLATAGTGDTKQRLIKLWCNYVFTLSGEGKDAIRSTHAVLLADQISLLPGAHKKEEGETPEKEGETLAELCAKLDTNCAAWYQYFKPSRKEATLAMALVLFADVQGAKLPIIQVQDMEIDVLEEWWPS